ncbi:TetR family transcriptional regulator [Nocardia farcinica]|uniref:HTH-type transcriptional repressor KstR2 n=1 Tax=Nocardia farcinica TaxID=37329 RepID=A0A0H5NWH6_NOCFR|nr:MULTISPECIES: TetR/AcrR family transcriptional regulator [Nocardia]AXK89177.1 TetR/AcrR family transcriptional regulator [Nocardia farcinica]MBA4858520.1 TetR/AcrR family transcriptional regulator [Nocardia farcinica]MBC9819131.1 TetR/AcrR family transcriptional regulator [Nocardia farcinica]MBF6234877.1 TetR family transcriptional regulator [Nocardia farcinica]MBF6253797.1 TetR family transcriptional regulator [Nocardia farcinica]
MTDITEPRGDSTRARLLEAAVEAFAEKGFNGTTTRDIAGAAGMSPAAVYVHHKSKEELLYLISRAGHDETLELIRKAAASSSDPATALRTVIYDFAVHHARAHTSARIVNYELNSLSPEHLNEIRAIRQQIDQTMRDLVQRGIEQGVFDIPDARIASTALLSLGIDIARWYRDAGHWTPEDIATAYAEMALRIVGAA